MSTPNQDCRHIETLAREFAGGELALDPGLSAHIRACAPCDRLLQRERALQALLSRPVSVPQVDLVAPTLPASAPRHPARILRGPSRVLRLAGAAAAAVLVAALAIQTQRDGRLSFTETSSRSELGSPSELAVLTGTPVRIQSVVDVFSVPPADDEIVALTAGFDAVAARRPATFVSAARDR